MKNKPTNMAASVRARLLRLSKEDGEDFSYVVTRRYGHNIEVVCHAADADCRG